jgi:hypothetical protein
MTAGVGKGDAEMLAGLVVGLGGNGDAAGGGDRLEPDRYVDAVAKHFVFVGDHVSHVDADAELHHPVGGELVVAFRHQRLHRDRRLDSAHDAREFQQEAVAGVLHQPAAVIEDDRVDRTSMGLERGVRSFLVGAHHPRVAGDVSTDDGC